MATSDSTTEMEKRSAAGAIALLVAGHSKYDSSNEGSGRKLHLVVSPWQAVLVVMVFATMLAVTIVSGWYFLSWQSEWAATMLRESTGLVVTGAGVLGGATITAVLLVILRQTSASLQKDHEEAINRFHEAERELLAEVEERQQRPLVRSAHLAGE